MLVEVVTLWADDRRGAEDASVLQRLRCHIVNTALKWPTYRYHIIYSIYIYHRAHCSPDDGSFPELIRQLVLLNTDMSKDKIDPRSVMK